MLLGDLFPIIEIANWDQNWSTQFIKHYTILIEHYTVQTPGIGNIKKKKLELVRDVILWYNYKEKKDPQNNYS